MKNINNLQGASTLCAPKLNHSLAMEPQSTQDATECATRILDAKYKKADLQSVVQDNCKHLSANQQKKLLQLLKKYELLFDGTFGDWKTKLVSFQLKKGVSPYRGQAFPVPKIHKDTLIKEMERLCKLGMLERQPASEWASPLFIMPMKNKTICFLSSFWELNKRLVRKPFPIPKITQYYSKRDSLLQQRLISTWIITPLDWIQMQPKTVLLSFLGGNIPTSNYQ
jgi:hypothetical protein